MSRNMLLVLMALFLSGCGTFFSRHPEALMEVEMVMEEFIEDEAGLPPRQRQNIPQTIPQTATQQAETLIARPVEK